MNPTATIVLAGAARGPTAGAVDHACRPTACAMGRAFDPVVIQGRLVGDTMQGMGGTSPEPLVSAGEGRVRQAMSRWDRAAGGGGA